MAEIGTNVSADGRISLETIRGLGASWVRLVATPEHDLTDYLAGLRAGGIRSLLVLARESFDGGGNVLADYARRYGSLISAVQPGNEPDQESESSWSMSPAMLASIGRSARIAFGPEMPLVYGGLASGQPSWLRGADLSWCDALAVHPYTRTADSINWLLGGYAQYGKPLLVTEWGYPGDEDEAAHEIGRMVAWAGQPQSGLLAFFHFCADDRMVPGFGLLRADGSEKPAVRAFRNAARQAVSAGWPMPRPKPPQEAPTHVHDVGAGLLEWLHEAGTEPIACSMFLPLGRDPAEVECAYAVSGDEYRWSLVENRRLARIVGEAPG